ncbi:GDSL-type esterase/lipase family protein [Aeromonas hydrophila]|uniref:GDSL-type esterase/lipase family protein n=1 Tax=Aeromonas hydrophila TaxID=644 RepID=UPI002B4AA935|nr:GDSL-type esterase/lipase family protein [Aeromonas hydrophila]
MPSTPTDRLYGLTTSVAVKAPVQISADYNITLFGQQSITSSTFTGTRTRVTSDGMRVLLINQSNPVENGIWEAKTAAWVRAPDFDGARDGVNGTLVFSIDGDCWQAVAADPLHIGYDPINFRSTYPFSGEANLFQRSLRVPEASVNELPPLAARANNLLAFNNDGQPVVVLPESGSAADVLLDLASSAPGKGDALISVKQPFANSSPRTQHDVNAEKVSILDFGGLDDGVGNTGTTNNLNPITKGFAHIKLKGGILHFPYTTTGIYYINGSDLSISDAAGLEISVDNGVSFVLEGSYTPLIVKGLKVNREVKIKILPINYTFHHGPYQYRDPANLQPQSMQLNGTYEVPFILESTDFTGYQLAATAGTRPVITLTGGTDTLNIPFGATTERNVAVTGCAVYDEVGAINDATTGSVSIGVVTPSGYCLVEQTLSPVSTVLNKNGALSTIAMPVAAVSRDQFNSSLLTVKIVSDQLFQVCVNGIPLGTFDAGEGISGVAFGGYGRTSNMSWSTMYKVRNSKISGARPLRIIGIGDSTSDPNVPCSQYQYMTQFLASSGCQVYELNNLAVSGDTSAAQLARFNAVGISGYDVCIANIGINDIQGAVTPSVFAENVAAMAARCVANGVKFVLSLPTLWYSLAEANAKGQGGQDTLNNSSGSQYRAAAIRAIAPYASQGCCISMAPIRHEGQISADFLFKSGLDSVLMDNIHPTAYGRMMMGLGNAMAIMGLINPVGYRSKKMVAVPTRWYTSNRNPSGSSPLISVEGGEVSFFGSVAVIGGYTPGGTVINIDKELTNGAWSYLSVPALGSSGALGAASMVISPAGAVSFYNLPAGTTALSMDGMRLRK